MDKTPPRGSGVSTGKHLKPRSTYDPYVPGDEVLLADGSILLLTRAHLMGYCKACGDTRHLWLVQESPRRRGHVARTWACVGCLAGPLASIVPDVAEGYPAAAKPYFCAALAEVARG